MAKAIKSMTKAELIEVVITQGERLEKAKHYYRQQKAEIDKLTKVNQQAIKLLSNPIVKSSKTVKPRKK